MISPDEIRRLALKWWKPFLQSVVAEETFFPKKIERIGKIKPGDITQRFDKLKQEIDLLYFHSKNSTGKGYKVVNSLQNFRRTGAHELPENIEFETAIDYIHFLKKEKEWIFFSAMLQQLSQKIPALISWASTNCLWLADRNIEWENVLKVCSYFLQNPRPGLYIRQLPVAVHTKFIEENATLLTSLLDHLIPNDIRRSSTSRIAERYYLRYDEALIRLRFLDTRENCGGFNDISVPHTDFEKMSLAAKSILITENKMNFLALPLLPSTVACWSGGGFNISYLRQAAWLHHKNMVYWGDIDEHGFQILHQLRTYFPHTQSIMMDIETFQRFQTFAGVGTRTTSRQLPTLTLPETELFNLLKASEKNRLEQEKILQIYSDDKLEEIMESLNK